MELRKNKKDDMLSKRRNVATDEEPLSPLQVFIISGSGYIFWGKTKKISLQSPVFSKRVRFSIT